MLRFVSALACLTITGISCAQPIPEAPQSAPAALSAAEIMARVAANQDRSEQQRMHYVYLQHTRADSRGGKTIRCEEIADFRVTPSATATEKQLLHLDGRLLTKKGHYLQYDKLLPPDGTDQNGSGTEKATDDDLSINLGDAPVDRELVENLRSKLTSAPSKDGIGAELFPLTSKAQKNDAFRLLGREPQNGRDTYHLSFAPKDKSDFGWKGEAWIDTTSFEPVVVRTSMSRKIPFAVRALLGTSAPGLGFTIIYAPQPDGVWFPVSFGTEFKVNVLFFFRREITLSVANREFERTHVSSQVIGAEPSKDSR